MNIALPLDRMTIEDKLRTMETLWDDLSKNSDEVASPSWHKDVLQKREKRLQKGEELIHDWDAAKDRIRRSV